MFYTKETKEKKTIYKQMFQLSVN